MKGALGFLAGEAPETSRRMIPAIPKPTSFGEKSNRQGAFSGKIYQGARQL